MVVTMVSCWLSVSVGLAACSSSPDATETVAVDGDAASGDPAADAMSAAPTADALEAVADGDGGDGAVPAEWVYLISEQEGDRALFAVRPDGSDEWKLTGIDAYPVLSPEGSRIAFLVPGSDGGAELFVMEVDGTNQEKLADLDDDVGPVWSPDETRLAFSDYREDQYGDGDYEIFVVAVDGFASPQQATRNSTSDDLILPGFGSWSPDSSKIAFSRDFGPATTDSRPDNFTKVFVMDADGLNERQLVSTDDCEDWVPTWSPDGTRIAYFSHCDGTYAISVINADSSDARELVTDYEGNADWPPVWSPDGTRLAFYSRRDGAYTIDVVNADGTGLRRLVDRLTIADYLMAPPVWSPDGTRIAFSDSRDGDTEVFTINTDGTNLQQLTHNNSHDHVISWLSEPGDPAADAMSTVSTTSTTTSSPSPT